MGREVVTKDFSRFGHIEREEAKDLLSAYGTGKDESKYLGQGVEVFFNTHSGYVFLTDEDYNTAMLDSDGILRDFITCPNCGNEGLISEFEPSDDCCKEYFKEMNA